MERRTNNSGFQLQTKEKISSFEKKLAKITSTIFIRSLSPCTVIFTLSLSKFNGAHCPSWKTNQLRKTLSSSGIEICSCAETSSSAVAQLSIPKSNFQLPSWEVNTKKGKLNVAKFIFVLCACALLEASLSGRVPLPLTLLPQLTKPQMNGVGQLWISGL